MGTEIFTPMMAMFLLTFVVWAYMYARRIPFIQSSNLTPEQLTAQALTELSPPAVLNPSDNLKNLFELPVLFYALCLYLYVTQQVDSLYVTAAWLFVILRVAHSVIHCTVNIVLLRFGIYFVASAALWFMFFRASLSMLTS